MCKLNRALYGLRQASRAWYDRFKTFLLTMGFQCSLADTSMFVLSTRSTLIILLLYVDDIVITGNDPIFLQAIIDDLAKEFHMKDLGLLHFFLGIEVHHTSHGLVLSQMKYTMELLHRAGLSDCKPLPTPLGPGQHLSSQGTPFHNPTLYRSIVGAL